MENAESPFSASLQMILEWIQDKALLTASVEAMFSDNIIKDLEEKKQQSTGVSAWRNSNHSQDSFSSCFKNMG